MRNPSALVFLTRSTDGGSGRPEARIQQFGAPPPCWTGRGVMGGALASRMELHGRTGLFIQVTRNTYELIRDAFDLTHR